MGGRLDRRTKLGRTESNFFLRENLLKSAKAINKANFFLHLLIKFKEFS